MNTIRCNNCRKACYKSDLIKSCKCDIYCCKKCQDLLFEPSFIRTKTDIYVKQNGEFVKNGVELFQRTIQNTVYCNKCNIDLEYYDL